ncbi:hypothetical protein F9L07_28385 [Pimelobacter simplex]|uniref:Lipoprotein n=1 Tax=Nocardioides simplex TaxID=2045 RepID=A0A7J5DQK7_NOCSI|nr:hypothetical protein [Pimelobacter simplex]KAB2806953.1 hypothetical protein F9L07_28385 [Pimelobacter simplex]
MNVKKIAAAVLTGALLVGATACTSSEYENRKKAQSAALKNSLEQANLKEKLDRENDSSAIRYVYLISFAKPIGYYVIKGKVSSSGSQLAPEQDLIRRSGEDYVLDSAQDDGTYGSGDPGIFFFLGDGTMVSTTLDYIEADAPLPIDVPRLGGKP